MGRSTRGVRLVNLGNGDTVAALAVLNHEDLDRKVEGEDEAHPDSDGEEAPVAQIAEQTEPIEEIDEEEVEIAE